MSFRKTKLLMKLAELKVSTQSEKIGKKLREFEKMFKLYAGTINYIIMNIHAFLSHPNFTL